MRKLLVLLLAALLVLGCGIVYAADSEVICYSSVTTTAEGNDSISVTVNSGVKDAWLAVYFMDNEGRFLDLYQERSTGFDTVAYKLYPQDKRASEYTIQVSLYSTGNEILNKKLSVKYFSFSEQMAAIDEIILAESPENVIKEKAQCLGLDLSGRYEEIKDKSAAAKEFQKALKEKADIEPKDAQTLFAEITDLSYLNQADAALLSELIEKNDFLNVDKETDEYSWYEDAKGEIAKILADNMYESVEGFNDKFKTICYLYKLSETHILDLEEMLRKGNGKYKEDGEIVTLSFDDFDENLDSKEKKKYALEFLSGELFNSLSELKEAFDNAVEEGMDYTAKGNKGGGSSGGGGLSGGSAFVTKTENNSEKTNKTYFDDIANIPWAKDAVETFAASGFISGKAERKFCPNDNVTREEFVKMLVEVFNISGEGGENLSFNDVSENAWYYDYVMKAAKSGIVKGDGLTFGTGANISRQDIAVMLFRATECLNLTLDENEKDEPTDFASVSDYAKDAVMSMYRAGVINGMTESEFMPLEKATRAQAVKMIYEIYIRIK